MDPLVGYSIKERINIAEIYFATKLIVRSKGSFVENFQREKLLVDRQSILTYLELQEVLRIITSVIAANPNLLERKIMLSL